MNIDCLVVLTVVAMGTLTHGYLSESIKNSLDIRNCNGFYNVFQLIDAQLDASEYLFVINEQKMLGDFTEVLKMISQKASTTSRVIDLKSVKTNDWMHLTTSPIVVAGTTRTVVLFVDNEAIIKIFNEIVSKNLELWTVNYLIFGDEKTSIILKKILREGIQVLIVNGKQIEEACASKSRFHEVSLFNSVISVDGKVGFEKNIIKTSNQSSVYLKENFPSLLGSYRNFHGRILTVAAVENWPFLGLTKMENEIGISSGIDYNILQTLSKKLNFRYIAAEPLDMQWGTVLRNGTVTGMIGMVYKRQANLAINEFTITGNREQAVDFTNPYYMEPTTLLSLAPGRKNQAWQTFTPFTFEVWMLLALMVILIGPIHFLLSSNSSNETRRVKLHRISELIFEAFIVMSHQQVLRPINQIPSRIAAVSWFLFCFVCQVFYSTSLIASLTIPGMEKAIDSLPDLLAAQQDGIRKLVLNMGTSNDELFKEANSGIYKSIYLGFDPSSGYVVDRLKAFEKVSTEGQVNLYRSKVPKRVVTDTQGMIRNFQRVLNEGGVFVNARLNSEILATKFGRNNFHLGSDSFYPQSYGIVCPSGSPLKPVFDSILIRLSSSGLILKWSQDVIDEAAVKSSGETLGSKISSNKRPKALSIEILQGPFIILIIGSSLAIISFLLELLLNQKKKASH